MLAASPGNTDVVYAVGLLAYQLKDYPVAEQNLKRLLGMGYTNAQIASQLVVSVRTVDSHVAAVLAKLGAATRREAAASAAELVVLDAENR